MSKLCIKCDAEIPAQRVKMLPNTKVCVQCSTASPHTGMVVSYGEGDHTWTEIVVMDEEQQKEYDKQNPADFYCYHIDRESLYIQNIYGDC